jgi:predicted P-loop ATPase
MQWEATDKNGKPLATCANARRAILALGVKCRYDEFHDKYLIEGPKVLKLADLDKVVADLRRRIHAEFNFDPGKNNMFDAVEQLCVKNKFNPITDYLDSLTWDSTPRLDRWLITYLGAEDKELNREFGQLVLLAAVRRARKPGTKFDPITVLEGPMGSRKSMAIETMAGKENFSDQTILGAHDREVQELLAGVWLYEIAELSNIRKTDIEHMRSFASRTTDRARKAYGHFRSDQPRTPVFFATTNDDQYLKQADRRFWPVKTTTIDIEALRRDRDQLWAEASRREPGASIELKRELWEPAGVEQKAREERDPWCDVLAEVVGEVDQGEERVFSRDLLTTVLGIHQSKQFDRDLKRLGKCMRELKWIGPDTVRIGNRRASGYRRPVAT